MKKLFTFFAALLLAGSMWGTPLFSYDATTNGNITTTTGCSVTLYDCAPAKSNNCYGIKMDNSLDSIKVELSESCALSAGDTIKLTTFTTAGTPNNNYKVILSTSSDPADAFYTFDLTEKTNILVGKYIAAAAQENLRKFYILCSVPSSKNLVLQKVEVVRGKTITSQNYYGFKKNGETLANPADYTWTNGDGETPNVVTMTDAYKSTTAPADYTWSNHITYSDSSTKDENVAIEFTLNGNYWEATHEFSDQTVKIRVPLDRTVNVYVHFVEDWRGSNEIWSAVGGSWANINSATETIGGCTWYKTTYNNTAATTFQISNGNGSNSVIQDLSAETTGNVYYVAYNKWDGSLFRLHQVTDPTRHSVNIFFQDLSAQGWENTDTYKMWLYDLDGEANTYGTQDDYVFTASETYAGQTWHKASVHYFGDSVNVWAKFKQGDDTWQNAKVVTDKTHAANLYIYRVSNVAETKTFNAKVATSMLLKNDAVAKADVTSATVWDWAKAGTSVQLSETTYPSKTTEMLLANIEGVNNNDYFNAAALTATTEYAVRESKYYQGGAIKFTTTVPGVISVVFSNTGNRTGDANNRILNVNGENTSFKSLVSNANTTATGIEVAAGEVVIKGVLQGDGTDQYLRIYKITFTPTTLTLGANGWSTFCAPFDFTFAGATAYKATLNAEKTSVALTEVTGKIKAGEGIILNGTEGAAVTITPSVDATALENNDLVGVTVNTELDANYTYYVLATEADVTAFHEYTGAYIPAGKACLKIAKVSAAPARITIGNPVATAMENAMMDVKASKALINGKIVIVRGNRMFDVNGMMVK